MNKKRISVMLSAAMLATMLSGCGNTIPELSEEETQQVSEYASAILLSYDTDYQSRLLDEDEIAEAEAEEARKKAAEEAAKKAAEEEAAAEAEKQAAEDAESGAGEVTAQAKPIAEFLGLEGVEITYQGFELTDFYPAQAEVSTEGTEAEANLDAFFSMNAAQGDKLVILKFQVSNLSAEDKTVDLLSQNVRFRLSYNGAAKENALTTMLTDDLSTMNAVVAAGSSTEAVLVTEMPTEQAQEISSIALSIKYNEETETLSLQ